MSSLFAPLRDKLLNLPILSKLFQCIVCISVWVGIFVALIAPYTVGLFEASFIREPADLFIWGGWSAATTWAIALKLGDAQ